MLSAKLPGMMYYLIVLLFVVADAPLPVGVQTTSTWPGRPPGMEATARTRLAATVYPVGIAIRLIDVLIGRCAAHPVDTTLRWFVWR